MNSKENVKLILKGTPIRLKYASYEYGDELEIIRLNDISEIRFTDGDESLCKLNKSFIDYKGDDFVTMDEELSDSFEDAEDMDLDIELSLGTEEIEFVCSIGKDSIDNILSELPLEINYTEFRHKKIIMNDLLWIKKNEKDAEEKYSFSYLNPEPCNIPNINSKGGQFWNVITKCD